MSAPAEPRRSSSGAVSAEHAAHRERILIFAPTANDARLAAGFLESANFQPEICTAAEAICRGIQEGCGALVLAEEVLVPQFTRQLIATLEEQPSWSDIPITLVCSAAERTRNPLHHMQALRPSASVALIERPFRPETLVSMVESALRSRRRQYQVRDLLDELRTNEARVRRIFEQSVVGMAELDLRGAFVLVNDRYCETAGRTREELLKLTLPDLTHADDAAESRQRIAALAGGASSFIVEKRLVRPDGRIIWVHDHLSAIRDALGRPCGITLASADITTLKEQQQQLARSRDEAVAASRAKDEFLASLSHELRTPLNPVLLLASEGAHNSDLPPSVQADFQTISRNVALEARLIDDLLDLTRITRGKLQIERQPQPLHVILEDAIATVQGDFAEKQISLKRRFTSLQPTINGDAVRLQQVFWNVLKNAVKFTPTGGSVQVESSVNDARTHVSVAVTDTGIGMTEHELSRIFDAFVQGDHATGRTRHFGGLGLGLAISKRLVDLHGGQITARSEGPGSGATFTVELPLVSMVQGETSGADAPRDTAASTASRAASRRILLVDDHEATRAALSYLLQRRHFAVVPAGSVAEALAVAQRQPIDLIVSDIGLPDGTGYDVMEQFGKPNGVKGIALTGYGMEQDMAMSEQAGFSAHLTKPVRIEALDEALRNVLATA